MRELMHFVDVIQTGTPVLTDGVEATPRCRRPVVLDSMREERPIVSCRPGQRWLPDRPVRRPYGSLPESINRFD